MTTLKDHLLLPLQDHGYERRDIPLQHRAIPWGVRVMDRLDAVGQYGHYVDDPGARGDLRGWYHWAPGSGGVAASGGFVHMAAHARAAPSVRVIGAVGGSSRSTGAWAACWPAILEVSGGGSTAAGGAPTPGIEGAVSGAAGKFFAGLLAGGFGAIAGIPGGGGNIGLQAGGFGDVAGVQGGGGNVGLQGPDAQFGLVGGGGNVGLNPQAFEGGVGAPGGASPAPPPRLGAPRTGPGAGATSTPPPALPILDSGYQPDGRYAPKQLSLPEDWPCLPGGTVVGVLEGSKESSQETVVIHGDPRLVAVNFAGDPACASLVFDLDDQNRIDSTRAARLHSAWRVVRPRPGRIRWTEAGGLAWQLGRSGQDVIEGLGLAYDSDPGEGEQELEDADPAGFRKVVVGAPPGVVAAFGRAAGGPLYTGGRGDKHRIGSTADNEPILAGHLDTSALWLGTGGDGPLDFEKRRYSRPKQAPLRTRVHLTYDARKKYDWLDTELKGVWRWEAESFFQLPPETPDIPIREIPGPGIPRVPDVPREPPTTDEPPTPGGPPVITRLPIDEPSDADDGPRTSARPFPSSGLLPIAYRRRDRSDPHDPYAASTLPIGLCALVVQPADTMTRRIGDTRRSTVLDAAAVFERLGRSPITLRAEGWTLQDAEDEPVYTERPSQGRYAGGTASGGLHLLPPEMDLADVETGTRNAPETVSTAYLSFDPSVRLAWGTPSPTAATFGTTGWTAQNDTTTGDLNFVREIGNTGRLEENGQPIRGNRTVTRVTVTPYTATDEDRQLLVDTDAIGGSAIVNFPAASSGNAGNEISIHNTGSFIARTVTYTARDSDSTTSANVLSIGNSGRVLSDGTTDWWHT